MKPVQASDGITIPVTWDRHGHDVVFLFCHGITSERDEDGIFSDFHKLNFFDTTDAFYFDFRGHGASDLSPDRITIAGMRDDFRTCITLLSNNGYKQVVVIAASFGASIVLLESTTLKKLGIRTLVFWNPVISYVDTFVSPQVEWARSFFPGSEPLVPGFSSSVPIPGTEFVIGPQMAREIATLHPENAELPEHIRLLCVHGTNDQHVPIVTTERFCLRNSTNAEFRPLVSATHGFPEHLDDLYQLTTEWLKTVV